MAKYETTVKADFDDFIRKIKNRILQQSVSASVEEECREEIGSVKIHIIVFERYSIVGNNRTSLTVTFIGNGDQVKVIGITSGGSQAMLFKINTVGEKSFLQTLQNAVEQ